MRLTEHYSLRVMDDNDYYNVDDFNKNTESIDNLIYNLNYKVDNLQPSTACTATYQEVTLVASAWENGSQSVNVEGVTLNSIAIIGLAMNTSLAQIDAIMSAKINVTAVTNGSITFEALDTVPSIDVPISVAIFN